MTRHARVAASFAFGAILMQAAWILTLPPFRGIDEFDHAFRASAVANGQWLPSEQDAGDGRGNLQPVDRSIVRAAEPVCSNYDYTGPDNCRAVENIDADTVVIATAAGRYHPLFYWVIGSATGSTQGATALYVMRLVAATLCAAFIGLTGWTISHWAKSRWPYVATAVALTPVAIYSTSVPGPNGLEIVAAASLWAGLLGLARVDPHSPTTRTLLYSTVPAVLVLATIRQLGPLFLVLTACAALAATWLRGYGSALLRAQKRALAVLATAGTAASLSSLWWMHTAAGLTFDEPDWDVNPLVESLRQSPAWALQTVAAFPTRNEPASPTVYAIWLVGFAVLMIWAWRRTNSALRPLLLLMIVIAALLPIALSIPTIREHGPIWQGRYGLPFAVGMPLVAGLILDESAHRSRMQDAIANVFLIALVFAHCLSVHSVMQGELIESPLTGDPSWIVIHPWLPTALMAVGGIVLVGWHGAVKRSESPPPGRQSATDADQAFDPSVTGYEGAPPWR